VFAADDQANLSLARLASHPSAETPKRSEVSGVLDVGWRPVTVDDDGFVLNKRATSLVITPDALRLRVGRRASDHAPKQLQSGVDPVILVDDRAAVALNAGTNRTTRMLLRPPPEHGPRGFGDLRFIAITDQYRS
ncbi:MAG: hypothetical protein HYX76_16035, partial [Acidobacteria bacterium]|nr:hypothetical protein [Acidobacteriota bacterium]